MQVPDWFPYVIFCILFFIAILDAIRPRNH